MPLLQALVRVEEWGATNTQSASGVFFGAINLVGYVDEPPATVTEMSYMFGWAMFANVDVSGWDVSNVENMAGMFARDHYFSQNIGGWNVENVTNMINMFNYATNFNQDIGSWRVGSWIYFFGNRCCLANITTKEPEYDAG